MVLKSRKMSITNCILCQGNFNFNELLSFPTLNFICPSGFYILEYMIQEALFFEVRFYSKGVLLCLLGFGIGEVPSLRLSVSLFDQKYKKWLDFGNTRTLVQCDFRTRDRMHEIVLP